MVGYSYLFTSSIIHILTTFYLLIPIAFSIGDAELGYKCLPNDKPFTSNYSDSRMLVVEQLITKTPLRGGFWAALDERPRDLDDKAYGLSLCRGDLSVDDCLICVYNAALTAIDTHHCPNNRSAIIWRKYCFFKYSDVDFFGKPDTDNEFSRPGINMWNQETSAGAVREFMANLSQTAIQATNPILYAYGASNIKEGSNPDDYVTVYGVAQCTWDISRDDCTTCLNKTVNELVTIRQGGIIQFGSCNMRYETYDFLSN